MIKVMPPDCFDVPTRNRSQMIDVTEQVRGVVLSRGVQRGRVIVYVPHTTAGITINENADPAVEADILSCINKVIPWDDGFKHMEGNSAAHIKVSLFGPSELIPLEEGRLVLGTWQGIFFCEFDGPRTRKVKVTILSQAD